MSSPGQGWASTGGAAEYTVLAAKGTSTSSAVAAIGQAGGTVLETTAAVGMFRVTAPAEGFITRAAATAGLVGATVRTPIASAGKPRDVMAEREGGATGTPGSTAATTATGTAAAGKAAAGKAAASATSLAAGLDPLDADRWGLTMIHADKSRAVTPGRKDVTVGIMDTGVDASNPDIAPNFSRTLSRNFAPDQVDIDGPCEDPTCLDPVGTDDHGHGTHVAGIIGAAANGSGISGVAPGVTLVELKAAQDSGFFFLDSVVKALVYAGDAGIDVVNMSFYLDPWRYNCLDNPADTPEQRVQQRTIIDAMGRALGYASDHGVTLVGSAGNEHDNLAAPRADNESPDYPAGTTYSRPVDPDSCVILPGQGPNVLTVSAVGPSGRKADYSNYGIGQIDVAAPGGWSRDGYGTPTYNVVANRVLSTVPMKTLQEDGLVDANGDVTPGGADSVRKWCDSKGACGYATYWQGTSMAAPFVSGVAALVVSRFGTADPAHPGTRTMDPTLVSAVVMGTATSHACPEPALQTYTAEGRDPEFNAKCTGVTLYNSFYGLGIVDAAAAIGPKAKAIISEVQG